jgi:spermidine synthase
MALGWSIALLSAAVIAYEILLTRLLAIVSWSSFAFMVISLALLGLGASGTAITLARDWLAARFRAVFLAGCVGFGIAAPAAFVLAQAVPFNPLEVAWDWAQLLRLLQLYLILAVPYFLAGTAIGLALTVRGEAIPALYRADLMGAGIGSALIMGALYALEPMQALALAGALAILAAAPLLRIAGRVCVAALLVALASLVAAGAWPPLTPSPYKELSLALTRPGAQVVAERSSPLGLLTVVDSPEVPFRSAPGLSLSSTVSPPPQLGLFTDAEGLSAINRYTGDTAPLAFLDQQTAALPFHLRPRPRTLILGPGGGADVLRALAQDVPRVDAVELDPQTVKIVRDDVRDFAGPVFDDPRVHVHVAEARAFAEASRERWDLIQLSLLDSLSAAIAGVQALSAGALYTHEALSAYLARLEPGGLLAITRWLRTPPRDSLKLLATAAAALRDAGVARPADRIAMIRDWATTTLIVKNGALTNAEIEALRRFATGRSFDLVWYPGMPEAEANRFNRMDRPILYLGARALLAGGAAAADFAADYKFYIEPASDDRPYFFRFFKWSLLPEVPSLLRQGALTIIDSGYLILVATLIQAVVAGAILIVLPLALRRRPGTAPRRLRTPTFVYFVALGLGFFMVEMALIQYLTLVLGHPVNAVALVLAAMLVFAGLGSGLADRLERRWPHRAVTAAILAVAVLALADLALVVSFKGALFGLPWALKAPFAVGLIAPLALAMGMPFPLGLRRVSRADPALVPWAWAVNGCASVAGAVAAALLAMHAGFTGVMAVALGAYGLAALAMARIPRVPAEGAR